MGIRVALPSGQHMQVTVPVGATGGSTLTVQYQSPGPSTSSYTNRGAVPPITPQNRDVPQLPQHDWNDKSSGAHVIPQGYGGASKVLQLLRVMVWLHQWLFLYPVLWHNPCNQCKCKWCHNKMYRIMMNKIIPSCR